MYFKTVKKLLLITAMLSFLLTGCIDAGLTDTTLNRNPAYSEKQLLVHYIDVGQGDAILIQINNKNLLIDAGPKAASDKVENYLRKAGVKKLDHIIATHPHEDHIGSMAEVVKKFKIGDFYAPKVTTNTKTFENMVQALKAKELKINTAKPGITLDLGSGIKCEILAPSGTSYEDLNHYSAIVKISYGTTSFLFTGDAEKINEKELLQKKIDLKADVLKVGHHGSSSSTSRDFLDAVTPSIAVITCGKGNDYGHPHKETLSELNKRSINTLRTDLDKDILIISDGSKISKK